MAIFLGAVAVNLAVFAFIVFDVYRPYDRPEDE